MITFFKDIIWLFRSVVEHHLKDVLIVISFAIISVCAKLVSILLFALSIYMLRPDSELMVLGTPITLELDIALIFILGCTISFLAFLDTHLSFLSFKRARHLGREATVLAQNKLLDNAFNLTPENLATINSTSVSQLSTKYLTRIPIHFGLSHQTVAELVSPTLQMFFSFLIITFIDYKIALTAVLLLFLGIPFIYSQSKKVHKNSEQFFGKKSSEMGKESATLIKHLLSQNGGYPKAFLKSNWEKNSQSKNNFLNALDTNLLANQKLGNHIGVVTAIARGLIFSLLLYYYYFANFDLETIIVLLGAMAFFFAACRTSLAMITKLTIYRPQVKEYHSNSSSLETGTIDNSELNENSNANGIRLLVVHDARNRFNLIEVILRLNKINCLTPRPIYFVDKEHQYIDGLSIHEHLYSTLKNVDLSNKSLNLTKEIIEKNTLFSKYDDLESVKLSANLWSELSTLERLIIRLGGLINAPNSSRVFLHIDILKALGETAYNTLNMIFNNHDVILVSPPLVKNEPPLLEPYLDSYGLLYQDNVWWFKEFETLTSSHEYQATNNQSQSVKTALDDAATENDYF